MYPRRGFDRWFPEPARPHELFWQNRQYPRWDQCQPEQEWEHSQWEPDNNFNHYFPGNFESGGSYRGSAPYRGSYQRRPPGNFRQKSNRRGRFNKGPKSSFSKETGVCSSSANLVNVKTEEKKHESEKAKAPSKAPKEIKQEQTDSAPLTEQSNPSKCQVRTKDSKVVISAQEFSFRLPHDSLACPQIKQECLLKKPEEIKVEPGTASLKAEDYHREAPALTLSSSVTLENLRPIKEEETVAIQTKVQTDEGPSKQTASLPSAEMLSEKQEPSQTMKGFHSMVKEELVPVEVTKHDVSCPSVTNLSSAVKLPSSIKGRDAVPSVGKKKTALAQLKSSETAEDPSHHSAPLPSVEASAEPPKIKPLVSVGTSKVPFKIAKYFHSMEKEEPVQVAEDSQQITTIPTSEAPIKEQGKAEIPDGAYSVKKEEPLVLEVNQPTHHFSSTVLTEIPFLFDTTDNQFGKNEETELTQMADSHEDGDNNQTSVKPLATGPSSLQTTTSNIHSVPVLVRGKETDLMDFWETPSLHDEHLRKWAPEDYQEPPQSVDKADKCDRKPDRVVTLSFHCTRDSCEKNSDRRRVLEGCSCSRKCCYTSDSRYSDTNRVSRELHVQRLPRRGRSPPRSPPRRGRSPPRRARSPSQSPPRRGRSPPQQRRRSSSRRCRSPPWSPSRLCRSHLRSFPRRCRSLSRSPLRRGKSPTQSLLQLGWSPPQSSPLSPRRGDWSPTQSPPQPGESPLVSSPRQVWDSPQSPPEQDCCHSRNFWRSSWGREDNFDTDVCSLHHAKYYRKPTHERCQKRDFPCLYSSHKVHHHHSSRENKRKIKTNLPEKKKKKLTYSEVTEKKRTSSGEKRKPHKIKKKAIEAKSLKSHDNLSSANEVDITPKATENLQPVKGKESDLALVAAGSEDPDFPCQQAKDETGSQARSWTPSVRSAAVLARKEEIEQAYQQVLLNFAAVATLLLEVQPCMTEAMETALQATLRKFGNYYECKLKDFIDSFDMAEDA